jgi:hypothetical protein
MHITLSRKWLYLPLIGVVLIAIGGMLTARLAPTSTRPLAATPTTEATPILAVVSSTDSPAPAQASIRFLRTFYTADYRQRDQWLVALKPLASADGYSLLQNLITPALWKDLERAQTVVTADQVTVEDGGLTAEGVSKLVGNTPWQIRRVTVTLAPDAKWPGWTSTTHSTNILLSHEADGWKFVMLLSDDQAKTFQTQPKGGR